MRNECSECLSASTIFADDGGVRFITVCTANHGGGQRLNDPIGLRRRHTTRVQCEASDSVAHDSTQLLASVYPHSTSFTRIIVVLAILRQALGLQQSPPNRVLVGIALTLTILIMRPVWTDIYDNAFKPYDNGEITLVQAFSVAEKPVRSFMLAQTHQSSLEQMLRIANEPIDQNVEDISFAVVLPAFVISELKTAFQIGFMLFIPFLIIDLVVASVLMAMGMMMLSPLIISLPFKLVIFVLVDGWAMTVGTLSASFG